MSGPVRVLRSIAFDEESDSVVIEFMTPALDVKLNGVCLNHSVLVPATEEFRVPLAELHAACQQTLTGALGAFDAADPVDLEQLGDDDDEPSPYDHPADGGTG